MGKSCAFFGHRQVLHLDMLRPWLVVILTNLIVHYGVDTFYVGEHGEFDIMAFGVLMALKQQYPHIELILVYAHFQQLLRKDRILIYDKSFTPVPRGVKGRAAIPIRNSWVAQNCDMAVCYVELPMGGAYKAFCEMRQHNKIVHNLAFNPDLCAAMRAA